MGASGIREPLGQYSTSGFIKMGPFVSETDGKTLLTGLTIVPGDVRLSKNNGAFVQKDDANVATYDADGMYNVFIGDTDLASADNGHMIIAIHMLGALPVWRKFPQNRPAPAP